MAYSQTRNISIWNGTRALLLIVFRHWSTLYCVFFFFWFCSFVGRFPVFILADCGHSKYSPMPLTISSKFHRIFFLRFLTSKCIIYAGEKKKRASTISRWMVWCGAAFHKWSSFVYFLCFVVTVLLGFWLHICRWGRCWFVILCVYVFCPAHSFCQWSTASLHYVQIGEPPRATFDQHLRNTQNYVSKIGK